MTSHRKHSYAQFTFLVYFGDDVGNGPHGGFQQVSAFATDDPHTGRGQHAPEHDSIVKITGINKSVDVIMTRGVVDSTELDSWLDDIKKGGKRKVTRTVFIRRHTDDRTAAQTWKLVHARIVKHTSGPLNAKGTDVDMEELVLSGERLELA